MGSRRFAMRHVIFRWLVAMAIGLSVLMPLLSYILLPELQPVTAFNRIQTFVTSELAEHWEQPEARQHLLTRAANTFQVGLVLKEGERTVGAAGSKCKGRIIAAPVKRAGTHLGTLEICPLNWYPHARTLLTILLVVLVLWFVSGRIARRISRPLSQLSQVAHRIGSGDFSVRSHKARHRVLEIRNLASTLDAMAERLESQQEEQRELLAAVSHELRSPLTRMRVALEIAEQRDTDPKLLAALQEEISCADQLVSDMLANARLDFQHLERMPIHLDALVRRALTGQQLHEVEVDTQYSGPLPGDANVLSRAVDNLLDNAKRHGGGPTLVHIHREGELVWLDVHDGGHGFSAETLPHVFKSFYRSARGGVQGLGLGLSLVQRIAQAHGGHAQARNLPQGGACVGIGLPLKAPAREPTERERGG